MVKRSRRLFVAGVAAVVLVIPGSAFAATWAKDTTGVSSVCFEDGGLTDEGRTDAAQAIKVWNTASTSLRVAFDQCGVIQNRVTLSYRTLPTGNLGLTSYYMTRGTESRFIQAQIVFDDTQIDRMPNASAWWEQAICHEIGHALGLEHTTNPASCMQTRNAVPTATPSSADFAQLRTLYGGAARTVDRVTTTTTTAPVTQSESTVTYGDDNSETAAHTARQTIARPRAWWVYHSMAPQ